MRIQRRPAVGFITSPCCRDGTLIVHRYWDWSLDAQPNNNLSMAIYETEVFSPTVGFGGNGEYVQLNASVEGIFADWGRSGGGCVQDGPFTVPNFHVNIGEANGSSCLRRDFLPAVLNMDADAEEVQKVLDQPDFASFDRQMEGEPAFLVSVTLNNPMVSEKTC